MEQRILEQAHRVMTGRACAVVTGWAALRWQGAAYFDGLGPDGVAPLPVPLLSTFTTLRPSSASICTKTHVPPYDQHEVAGIPVTTPLRALFDEVVARGELWAAVTAISMTLAAGLVRPEQLPVYAYQRASWTGIQLFRDALQLATPRCASPREVWLLMAWRAAGLPEPLVNEPVFDSAGNLVGVPDLFDPTRGLAGEYQGGYHWQVPGQRGRDLMRAEKFRMQGLVPVEVAQGDTRGVAMQRLIASWQRLGEVPADGRSWTLEKPDWWLARDERLARELELERGSWPLSYPELPADLTVSHERALADLAERVKPPGRRRRRKPR